MKPLLTELNKETKHNTVLSLRMQEWHQAICFKFWLKGKGSTHLTSLACF